MPLDVLIQKQLELYFQLVPNHLQYLSVKIVNQNLKIENMITQLILLYNIMNCESPNLQMLKVLLKVSCKHQPIDMKHHHNSSKTYK
jgi:hypothetical protein